MLSHKEPIFSCSTGRWPPEWGPMAQKKKHKEQIMPGHRVVVEPRSPSKGRGSQCLTLPHTLGTFQSRSGGSGFITDTALLAAPPLPHHHDGPSLYPTAVPQHSQPHTGGQCPAPRHTATISPCSPQRAAPFYRSALSQGHRCCSAAANEVIPDHATEFAMEREGKRR